MNTTNEPATPVPPPPPRRSNRSLLVLGLIAAASMLSVVFNSTLPKMTVIAILVGVLALNVVIIWLVYAGGRARRRDEIVQGIQSSMVAEITGEPYVMRVRRSNTAIFLVGRGLFLAIILTCAYVFHEYLIAWIGFIMAMFVPPTLERMRRTIEILPNGITFNQYGRKMHFSYDDIVKYGIWRYYSGNGSVAIWLYIQARDLPRIDVALSAYSRSDVGRLLYVLRRHAAQAHISDAKGPPTNKLTVMMLVTAGAVLLFAGYHLFDLINHTVNASGLFNASAALGVIISYIGGNLFFRKYAEGTYRGWSIPVIASCMIVLVPSISFSVNSRPTGPGHTVAASILKKTSSHDSNGTGYYLTLGFDGTSKRIEIKRSVWSKHKEGTSVPLCLYSGTLGYEDMRPLGKPCPL